MLLDDGDDALCGSEEALAGTNGSDRKEVSLDSPQLAPATDPIAESSLVQVVFKDAGPLGIEFYELYAPYIVKQIHAGGLAYEKGLLEGDLLTHVDHTAVDAMDWEDVVGLLQTRPMTMSFHRKLPEVADEDRNIVRVTISESGSLGIEFEELKAPYVVATVHSGGRAHGMGLLKGDRMTHVGDKEVDGLDWDGLVACLTVRPVTMSFFRGTTSEKGPNGSNGVLSGFMRLGGSVTQHGLGFGSAISSGLDLGSRVASKAVTVAGSTATVTAAIAGTAATKAMELQPLDKARDAVDSLGVLQGSLTSNLGSIMASLNDDGSSETALKMVGEPPAAADTEADQKFADGETRKAAEIEIATKAAEEASREEALQQAAEREAEQRLVEEAAQKAAEEEAARQAAEEASRQEALRQAAEREAQEAAQKAAEEEAARQAAEEASRQEALRQAAEQEAEKRLAEEAAQKAAEEEAARQAAEEASRQEASQVAEQEAEQRLAEEAARNAAEEEAARQAAEEASRQEDLRQAAEREVEQRLAEEAAQKAAEAEEASKKEALRQAAEQEAEQRLAEEAAQKAAEEEAARQAAEEALLQAAEREAEQRLVEEAAQKAAEEEVARQAAEEASRQEALRQAAEREAEQRLLEEATQKAAEEEEVARQAAEVASREEALRQAADREAEQRLVEEAAKKAADEEAARQAAEVALREEALLAARHIGEVGDCGATSTVPRAALLAAEDQLAKLQEDCHAHKAAASTASASAAKAEAAAQESEKRADQALAEVHRLSAELKSALESQVAREEAARQEAYQWQSSLAATQQQMAVVQQQREQDMATANAQLEQMQSALNAADKQLREKVETISRKEQEVKSLLRQLAAVGDARNVGIDGSTETSSAKSEATSFEVMFALEGHLGLEFQQLAAPYIVEKIHDVGVASGLGIECGDELVAAADHATGELPWESLVQILRTRPVVARFSRDPARIKKLEQTQEGGFISSMFGAARKVDLRPTATTAEPDSKMQLEVERLSTLLKARDEEVLELGGRLKQRDEALRILESGNTDAAGLSSLAQEREALLQQTAQLHSRVEQSEQQCTSLTLERDQLRAACVEETRLKEEFRQQASALNDRCTSLMQQFESLRNTCNSLSLDAQQKAGLESQVQDLMKMNAQWQQVTGHTQQTHALQSENYERAYTQLEERLRNTEGDLILAQEQAVLLQNERQNDFNTIQRLQSIIESVQESGESGYGHLEAELLERSRECTALRRDCEDQRRRIQELLDSHQDHRESIDQCRNAKAENDRLVMELARSKEENSKLGDVVERCVEKLEKESRERPHLVDKRMVTQMLAAYLEQRDHPRQAQEIMTKMADLLGFTSAEREQVGLSQRRRTVLEQEQPSLADVADSFVDFLLEESET